MLLPAKLAITGLMTRALCAGGDVMHSLTLRGSGVKGLWSLRAGRGRRAVAMGSRGLIHGSLGLSVTAGYLIAVCLVVIALALAVPGCRASAAYLLLLLFMLLLAL